MAPKQTKEEMKTNVRSESGEVNVLTITFYLPNSTKKTFQLELVFLDNAIITQRLTQMMFRCWIFIFKIINFSWLSVKAIRVMCLLHLQDAFQCLFLAINVIYWFVISQTSFSFSVSCGTSNVCAYCLTNAFNYASTQMDFNWKIFFFVNQFPFHNASAVA